jgi:adenylosuccinate synthase
MPGFADALGQVKPVFKTVPGWKFNPKHGIRNVEQVPQELSDYLGMIEDYTGVPVLLLSIGPGREETLEIDRPFSFGHCHR